MAYRWRVPQQGVQPAIAAALLLASAINEAEASDLPPAVVEAYNGFVSVTEEHFIFEDVAA